MLLSFQPSLVDQAYETIASQIADGTFAPGAHLVQEALAARYGVSRQPIQHALLLLKADGLIVDGGRRGLVVAALDVEATHRVYQVRAALDGLAARLAAQRCAGSPASAKAMRRGGEAILQRGRQAIKAGEIAAMITHDIAFHNFIYEHSGNPVIGRTAAVHWRFLRRVMGEVLRHSEPPASIWLQHGEILDSIVSGRADEAEERVTEHIRVAAARLTAHASRAADADDGLQNKRRKRTRSASR